MKPIETVYRDHRVVIRDEFESPPSVVAVTVAAPAVPNRIIEIDQVDVTSRCRVVATDEERTEEARRFIDRIYPKGKSEPKGKSTA